MNVSYNYPDSFSFLLPSDPCSYLTKRIYSHFLKLPGFWVEKKNTIVISETSTFLSFLKFLSEEKNVSFNLKVPNNQNHQDYLKVVLMNNSRWAYDLIFGI